MKTTDLKPLMVFHPVSDLAGGPDFVIDSIEKGKAFGRWVSVPGGEDMHIVPLEELLDTTKFAFDPVLTAGTMHEKIKYLQDYVSKLKRSQVEEATRAILSCNCCGASLKQGEMMVCAVCDKALGVKVTPVEGNPNTFQYEFPTVPRPPPHEYVETTPYKGCGTCGFGPGAFIHNSHEVRRYQEALAKFNVQVTPDPNDPSMVNVTFELPDVERQVRQQVMDRLNKDLVRASQKAVLEKTRRIHLMGRVDELKAALGDAKRGFELELPGQWPERFNVLLEQEPTDPKDWTPRYDYKARPTSPLSFPEGNNTVLYHDTLAKLGRVEPLPPGSDRIFLNLSVTLIDTEGNRSVATLAHGADLAGVNAFEVGRADLCVETCAWCESLAARCRSRGGRVVEPDPFHELSSVLWFLASLTSDHDPGCIVKDGKGEPCDCEVMLREGEPWWRRVRASLSLPAALKGRLEKVEAQLKARRVVAVTPVAGTPGPNGDGTVYEFKMPEGRVERLLVLRHEPGTLDHAQMRAISDGVRKKLPGVLVLFAQPNWELTLLELPKP